MIEKAKLISFKKMWTWLSGYPAHDRNYYMTNVANLDEKWLNSCPLANSEKTCDGCRMLWNTAQGSLCSDPKSPLIQWLNTSIQYPDLRSLYASRVAVLAMNFIKDLEEASPPMMNTTGNTTAVHSA